MNCLMLSMPLFGRGKKKKERTPEVTGVSISPIQESSKSVSSNKWSSDVHDINRVDDTQNSIRSKPPSIKSPFKGSSLFGSREENVPGGHSSQSSSLTVSNGPSSPSTTTSSGRSLSQNLQPTSDPTGSLSPGGSAKGTGAINSEPESSGLKPSPSPPRTSSFTSQLSNSLTKKSSNDWDIRRPSDSSANNKPCRADAGSTAEASDEFAIVLNPEMLQYFESGKDNQMKTFSYLSIT
ncbi:unnamed protein product [Allacma fusca]|uniref:Uncharacterized protein n=1 Tax=Allacma fusca TaxID=39272 RepID=A0A8J2JK83_9HEXA|nr:unnamed protein product [Allacma fusca]